MLVEQSGLSSDMTLKRYIQSSDRKTNMPCTTRTAKTLALRLVPMLPMKVWALNVETERKVQCMPVDEVPSSLVEYSK
jgi:hypothetical protein